MSHYAVAIIHRPDQDIDDMLAPYDENIKVAPYVEHTKQEAIDYVRKEWTGYQDKTDEECYEAIAEDYRENDLVDESGSLYSTYNTNSKWDWYEVGGRFSNLLKGKDGLRYDEGCIRNMDFSMNMETYNHSLRFWDVAVDNKPLEPGETKEQFITFYNENYFRTYYKGREAYAKTRASFSTYAVITPNGVWHAKGKMGWWGCSSETPEEANDWDENYLERFINHADEDLMITIVDCHI